MERDVDDEREMSPLENCVDRRAAKRPVLGCHAVVALNVTRAATAAFKYTMVMMMNALV